MATTAVMTSSAFLSIIRENKLVDEERLQACLRTVSPGALTGEDALPIADALVEQKLLTRFQANLLLQGKSKSLRITSKYRLLDRLGAGGMGLVYLCEHIRMKRLVALKVLPNAQAKEPGNLERFYREAQAVAALKHTNIVQAYDVDTDNGIHYLVMEYIDGINLEKLVTSHGPLDPHRAAHYMAQAADGLQHAAERGLVHRDIKPSNLLIDREGYIKVLDMGLARFFDTRADTITERFDSSAVIGTADFISPEQALNSHEVDIRADIYSLGCTFYYLLTGRAPFHDANVTQKLLLHQIREPVPIEQFVPDIDPELSDVIRKMMAKKPEDRFQTPGEVVAALAPWTEDAIAPPTELPASPQAGALEAGMSGSTVSNPSITSAMPKSKSKLAPKPSRGMMTERMTESAIRRMDGLPKKDEEEPGGSKLRWFIAGFLMLFAVGGLVFVAVKPWESDKKPVAKDKNPEDELPKEFDDPNHPPLKKDLPKVNVPKKDPPLNVQALGDGFVQVKLDAKSKRPSAPNGNIRATATDVLLISGPDLRKNARDEAPMLEVLRAQMIGGKGGPGTWNSPIIPYAMTFDPAAKAPNTLLTVDVKGGLRPLALGGKEYFVTRNFVGVSPEFNVLVRDGDAGLPKGMTTINSLVSEYWDFIPAEGGSTLRVNSGALLFMSSTSQKSFTFGAGSHPLVLDFNGKTGYVMLSTDQPDFTKVTGGREYIMRAEMVNFGTNPLVLSGISGTVLRLDNVANANPKLVIQSTQLDIKDKSFRVTFNSDANLGAHNGAVTINDAALFMTAAASVEADRPLTIVKYAQLSATNAKGQLRWAGKISGGKLGLAGGGQVVLNRRDNDYSGGTDIWSGAMILAAEGGTPAGSGGVTVQTNGTLTGTGIILKDLIVKGGTLQPGSDDGKSLVLNGKLVLEKIAPKDKNPEKLPTIRFRLKNSAARPMVYSQPPPLDLSNAKLQVQLIDDFKPTADDKCVLITNRSGLRAVNNFRDAPQFGTVKTSDNKWTAKISYTANGEKNTIDGGVDVMLYDFAPAPVTPKGK